MSFGEEKGESTFDPTVTCDRCKEQRNYWDCLIRNGRTICDSCSSTEEKRERKRLQVTAKKSFECEMEELRRKLEER